MRCETCINGDGFKSGRIDLVVCRLKPKAFRKEPWDHCAQGTWYEWTDRFHEWVPYYWGEWEKEPPTRNETEMKHEPSE